METVLWQTLAGTRGGPNRARVLRALADQPRNANQLADHLELAYNQMRTGSVSKTTAWEFRRTNRRYLFEQAP